MGPLAFSSTLTSIPTVPHKITADNVTAAITAESDALHIHIDVCLHY